MPIDFYQEKIYTLFNNTKIITAAAFAPKWKKSKLCGPGGIRTLDLFSAMAKNAGENRKKEVFYVYYRPNSTVYFSVFVPNCTRVVPDARENERRPAALSKWKI